MTPARGYIQTANGAHTATVVTRHLDSVALHDAVVAELRGVGLSSPAIATDGSFSSSSTAEGGNSGDALVSYVNRYDNLEFTQVGPTTVIESLAGYEVVGAERVDEYTPEPLWALDHYVIVEEDGQLRIASHQVISVV